MKTNVKTLLPFTSLLFFGFILSAEYHVDKDYANTVKFISKTPIHEFEGITDKIDGYLFSKDDDTIVESEIYFEVDLASINTGIGMRDRDMRENYLETDKYPYATYKGVIKSLVPSGESKFNVNTMGVFSVHGKEKPLSVTAQITNDGDGYKISSEFSVFLKDYDIDVPKLMFMKVNEEIKLRLDFRLKKVK